MEQDKKPKTTINLITPPDKLYNVHTSFLLVYPSDDVKSQLQNLIDGFSGILNVYIYSEDQPSYEWLFSVLKMCDFVVLDIDNIPNNHRDIISFLIAHSNVFWLTKGENEAYNIISKNRIYNLDWLQNKLGGNIETQSQ